MHTLIRHDADSVKKSRKMIIKRDAEIKKEKDTQEKQGIVNKPSVVGRYKYKMRKTDF